MAKIKMLAAFAVGYVAGSAAGRQRYEDIKSGAQRLAGNPKVQSAARKTQDTIVEKAPVVVDAVKNVTTSAAGCSRRQGHLWGHCGAGRVTVEAGRGRRRPRAELTSCD